MVLGMGTLAYMIYGLGFSKIILEIEKTGFWFFPIIGSWLLVYILNALAFRAIIQDPLLPDSNLPWLTVLRLTVTGYIINYVTPFVALGGEPYKIMELKKYVGFHKSSSSVILYAMMHIFSHILFWLFSVFLILMILPYSEFLIINCAIALVLGIIITFWFLKVYKKGFTVNTIKLLTKVPIPFFKRKIQKLFLEKLDSLEEIDTQIRFLYTKRRSRFHLSLFYEFISRIVTCAEIYLTATAIGIQLSIGESIVISSLSSLFANLVFFSPMQLGVREGGLALAFKSINLSPEVGIFIGVIMRIRELVWIAIGMIWMRVAARSK